MKRSSNNFSSGAVSVCYEDSAGGWGGPAQLGCVSLLPQPESHLQAGCPSRMKMRKFNYEMLAKSKMLSLGQSPSGRMFKGMWLSDEGLDTPVAIKAFHRIFSEEMSKQVSRELKGQVLRHRNLLCPHGYCIKEGKLHLFYEYMVNGSLDQHIFTEGRSPTNHGRLSWARRCSIISGVAMGLHHLHSNGAVHGSVKSSNILLDQDMTARLGDFGYSRAAFTVNLSDITYLPPECCPETVLTFAISEPTTEKDVFFFGSVIMEVVCGRKTSRGLVDWVWELYEGANILGAVDETLSAAADFTQPEAENLLLLALACSHTDPKQRPGMQDIVNILVGNAPLLVLPSRNPEYKATCDVSQDATMLASD